VNGHDVVVGQAARYQAAFVFEPAGRRGPRRFLRRRRTTLVFEAGGGVAALFCAIFSAIAFGGRPGPPGRHVPRVLRRRRRRPFFAGFVVVGVEMPPSSEWIAERTSCCTRSRINVTTLRCLGIQPSLPTRVYEYTITGKGGERSKDYGAQPPEWSEEEGHETPLTANVGEDRFDGWVNSWLDAHGVPGYGK